MKKILSMGIGIVAFFFASATLAYETLTHSLLTALATERSILKSDPSLLRDMGLPGAGAAEYFAAGISDPLNLTDTISQGAVYEDDHFTTRVFNHFFDPQSKNTSMRGMQVGPILSNASPDWALEDVGNINDRSTGRAQEYSFRDGQINLFDALTAQTPAQRRALFSRVFQTLGHITHHLQDMAQPQHVRNDQHVHDISAPFTNIKINPPWSFYERYTRDWANSRLPGIVAANPYPIPAFGTARQFWHTTGETTAQWTGMADFTSNNYVSFGTQYQYGGTNGAGQELVTSNSKYPLPNGMNRNGSNNTILTQNMTVILTDERRKSGPIDFVIGSVSDDFHSIARAGQRLASPSILNVYLHGRAMPRRMYVENSATYDDAHAILLPRAVAFSAGLINHFFRGRINLRRDGTSSNWFIDNVGAQAMNGTFSIYAEDAAGNRNPTPGAQFGRAVGPGQSISLPIAEQAANVVKLIAVFRGQIGSEGDPQLASGFYAVAGKVIDYTPIATKSSCAKDLSIAGGAQGANVIHDLGNTSGPVIVRMEAYDLADGLTVTANNGAKSLLASTNGLVSNGREFRFQHDPAARGSSKVTLKVTGNRDPKTVWNLTMSCPGSALPKAYNFRVTFSEASVLNRCIGQWTIAVNGRIVPWAATVSATESNFYEATFSPRPSATSFCKTPQLFYHLVHGTYPMSGDGQFVLDLHLSGGGG